MVDLGDYTRVYNRGSRQETLFSAYHRSSCCTVCADFTAAATRSESAHAAKVQADGLTQRKAPTRAVSSLQPPNFNDTSGNKPSDHMVNRLLAGYEHVLSTVQGLVKGAPASQKLKETATPEFYLNRVLFCTCRTPDATPGVLNMPEEKTHAATTRFMRVRPDHACRSQRRNEVHIAQSTGIRPMYEATFKAASK
ncbi:hypothetical protein V5799_031900 [Amblyomma americanum]|uniref:Uncharacterized protein n=1 Tax=Amblyomma americanum TaxID=6943 RepID=A0AAQ4DSQ3_AMBAM